MGFGILFIGYFLTFLMNRITYGYFFELLGILIILYASTKLIEYEKKFKYLFLSTIFLALLSCYFVFANVSVAALGWNHPFFTRFANAYEFLKIFADVIFHVSLCFSVASIAQDTGCAKIRIAAYRNTVFYGLYFVCLILARIPAIQAISTAATVIGITSVLLWLSWLTLNAIMIFSCYMHICDENDVGMEAKPSRFALINKMRKDFDEKEMRARAADAEYLRKKSENRKSKKKGKKIRR